MIINREDGMDMERMQFAIVWAALMQVYRYLRDGYQQLQQRRLTN